MWHLLIFFITFLFCTNIEFAYAQSNYPPIFTNYPFRDYNQPHDQINKIFTTSDSNGDSTFIYYYNRIPGSNWYDYNGLALNPIASFHWIPKDEDTSRLPYTFTICVYDNHKPEPAFYSKSFQIYVIPKPVAYVSVEEISNCSFKLTSSFANSWIPGGNSYHWSGNTFYFNQPYNKVAYASFTKSGKYAYSLTIFFPVGYPAIFNDTLICNYDSTVTSHLPVSENDVKVLDLNNSFLLNFQKPQLLPLTMEIYDLSGKKLFTDVIRSNNYEISKQNTRIGSGIYFIRLFKTEDLILYKKFIFY